MEYSPMLVLMLWALTPSDCWPTSGEQARVVEMPQPIMSVHPEGGYFTFNHGRPFLAERDPLTGAIDSNLKTTPVTTSSDDYLYEEYEESGESIDRKDSTKIYTRNDIASSSKESDLHKFLNLPVHYSSSGKFPLISSSYANTKIQGHGPLSNHKLHSSSTSTTSTVSPTYYTLKTTTAPITTPTMITKTSTTTRPTTTTTRTTTTRPTTQTTTVTTTARPTTTSAPSTAASSTTSITIPKTTKTTSTSKPFFSNYEYEYDYEYDNDNEKGGTEGTEKSQDYAFLGASSEVTKTEEKLSNTQASSPSYIVTSITKEQTTSAIPDTTTTTTSRPSISSTETVNISKTNTSSPSQQHNVSKNPTNQEDILDLRPPKPDLAVDLRPPQVQPSRPFSSVLPSKHQPNFGHLGFVRYPETPLMVENKKPISVYSPQNFSKTKPEIDSPHQSNSQNAHEDKQDSSTSYSTHIIHPSNKNGVGGSIVVAMASQDNSKFETNHENSNNNNNEPLFQDKTNEMKNKDRPYSTATTDKTRPLTSSSSSPLTSDKHRNPPELSTKPEGNPLINRKKTEGVVSTTDHNREEEPIESNIYQVTTLRTDYNMRPQGVQLEHSKLPLATSSNGRPSQEYYYTPVQGHAKPPSSYDNRPQGVPNSENKITQKPQASTTENSRLQIQIKPDNRPTSIHLPDNRPPNSHLSHNNNHHEHIHYSIEHNRPPNYPASDPNRPQNHIFGLRITERPRLPERPSIGIDYSRPPHGVRIPETKPHDQKKTPSGLEMRPPQNVMNGAETRPLLDNYPKPVETNNAKPVIFSKPQSGKKPDYNTVQFGQPSKVENHFISVSPGQENPSYSLQTSFSIGVPPPEQKQPPAPPTSGVHGVGQVLFPDDEPEKRPPSPPVWPHQRPPLINHPDSHPNIQLEKYPRPPWESHLKPPHVYHKKEPFPPIKRKPLPNILPQFRPNAKIGHAEPHIYLKPREPYDTLQPPPLPRPQFLRLEQEIEETKPLVHRRNGQTSTRVTTLQMMQGAPAAKRAALRVEDNTNENEPVFVVYPSNGNNAPAPPSDGVVVGTRGPQRPLPPDNLDIGDDLDSFPLDNNKNFQARVDTPVLKSKPSTSKPAIKNEFPYALIKPNPEEQTPAGEVTKEYTAFSPTVSSTEKEHDTEINIIPYLQDYMPFATKKPQHKDAWILGADIKHLTAPTISTKPANVEITQSPYKNENHRVVVSEGPQPQDFQAPFHASLTAPSQGWSVVQKKPNKEKNTEETTTAKELNEVQTTVEPKFDIQNFKPQLFGGFKPIVPPVEDENKKSKLNL